MTEQERAKDIWDAFCGELTQPPTDDMKQALSYALRVASDWVVSECDKIYTEDERKCIKTLRTYAKLINELEEPEND